MNDPHIVEAVDPDAAFAALSDPTRIDILRALWDAEDHEATFSELRRTVGMGDSGQFNYHLGTLTGVFVEQSDDGYELTLAGVHVVGSLLAGAYTMTGSIDPIDIDQSCPACGSSMTFRYEDEWVTIECDQCPVTTYFGVPPGVFAGYDVDSFPAVAERYARNLVRGANDGFCPYCEGRLRPSVGPSVDPDDVPEDLPDRFRGLPAVEYECDRCGEMVSADLGTALFEHPAVVSFYDDHDVDVRVDSIWRFAAFTNDRARIRDRDPIRATVSYPAGDERLTLTVDDSLSVLDVDRTRA